MAIGEIELGDVAKDLITGFEGVVVAEYKYLHGCTRFAIQPQKLDKDGKVRDPMTFDEPQLKLLKKAKHDTTSDTGGPHDDPPRRSEPSPRR